MQEMPAPDPAHAEHPFLIAAGVSAARALSAVAEAQSVPRRGIIFAPGAATEALYLLREGSVGLSVLGEGEARGVVEILGTGDSFLLPAVILGGAWPIGAEALAPSQLLRIPVEAFHSILAAEPGLAIACLALLSRQWRSLADQLLDMKMNKASDRVAHFLAQRVLPGGRVVLPEPRAVIAARLGMTPESLSRVMHGLEAAGLVRLKGRRIDVPDTSALQRAGGRD
jgi:CRP-like cAMP-binding protein